MIGKTLPVLFEGLVRIDGQEMDVVIEKAGLNSLAGRIAMSHAG